MSKRIFIFIVMAAAWLAVRAQDMIVVEFKGSEIVHATNADFVERIYFQEAKADTIPEAIDLGLPSGTKWAEWNIGASAPEEYGNYYAWGATSKKYYYYWNDYDYASYDSISGLSVEFIGEDIAGTDYDVAIKKWGGDWVMPTVAQYQELLDYCTHEWTKVNDVNGVLFTGANGNTLFLPAAGLIYASSYSYSGSTCYYWSSSYHAEDGQLAYGLTCSNHNIHCSGDFRFLGRSVRPVSR